MGDRRTSAKAKQKETVRVVVALAVIALLLLLLVALLPGVPTKHILGIHGAEKKDVQLSADLAAPVASATAAVPSNTAQAPDAASAPRSTRPAPTSYEGTVPSRRGKWKLYLDIDDVGNNVFQLKPFLAFPGPETLAVLPLREYSVQAAELAHAAGKEVILHLPMEADNPHENPGQGAILTSMSDKEIAATVEKDIDSVPYVIGVNNHMGSRATADPRVMTVVLRVLKSRNLFFLDSRTTARSVAKGIAGRLGVPFAEREVFLDNSQTKAAIESALKEAEQIAKRRGYAVMIGHVWTDTLAQTLTELYPDLIEEGFEFGKLSDLIKENRVHARTGD